ncbi:MAG TPA: PAS domain S-box protein [Tepidisphaeraceae bacterium]
MRVRLPSFPSFLLAAQLAACIILFHHPDRLSHIISITGTFTAALLAIWIIRNDLARRRASESLRQLNAALDHATEGIARLNAKGNYVAVSALYARCCGYAPSEMIGQHWTLILHPPERDKMYKALDQMLHGGVSEVGALARRKDGSLFHNHAALVALRDQNGKLLGHHRFMKDITLRKMSEAALCASERRFRVLAAHAPVGIFQCNTEGRCSYVNARWTDMTGINPRQAKRDGWFAALNPDDQTQIAVAWKEAAAAGKPWNAELRFGHDDANATRVSCSTAPIRAESGAIDSYIGIITDITALKESEETLSHQSEELRRSNRELEQFAYIASHDLQEPLRMVSSYTQLLDRRYRGKLGSDADEFIAYAVEGATRMRSLIDDVLDFAKVSREAPPDEPTELQPLLSAVLADLAAVIREKNAQITSDPLPVVAGNSSQLRQVLQNLVGNAIKFCKRPPRIHIEALRDGDNWSISIRDNGIGIDSKHFDKIFQAFQRLNGHSEFTGNGIGLAVCKRIVERHGGTIRVDSRPNEGSTFTFTLPAARPVAARPAAAMETPIT